MSKQQSQHGSASINVGVTSGTQHQSKFEVAAGRSVRLEIPTDFSSDHIGLAIKDLDILKDILTKSHKELPEIVSAVQAGNFEHAQQLATKIGISEDYFIQKGGGMWAVVIAIAIGCALLLARD
jgi:hypothetical protein